MNNENQIRDYIEQQRRAGFRDDLIKKALIDSNYDANTVEQLFAGSSATPAINFVSPPPSEPSNTPTLNQTATNTQNQVVSPVDNDQKIKPPKYSIFRALTDFLRSIRVNPVTFILSIVVSYVVAAVALVLVSMFIYFVIIGGIAFSNPSTSKLVLVMLSTLVLYSLWYTGVYSFVLSATAIPVKYGLDNQKVGLSTVLKLCFKRLGRVIVADFIFMLAAYWPVIIATFMSIILASTDTVSDSPLIYLFFILFIIACGVWMLLAVIRYILVPLIAIFEPDVPVAKTLGRSRQLLRRGGQWFVVKGILVILVLSILMSIISGEGNSQQFINSTNIAVNIFLILLAIIVNGVMTALYHNRQMYIPKITK